ncbi:uncharacterized protein LOC144940746 [Lampetra fluviatilis]
MAPLSILGGAQRLPFHLLLLLVFATWTGPRVKAQQDPFRRQFQRVPDHALRATAGAPRAHVRGVSTGECALLCLSERGFHCASFDWSGGGGAAGGAAGGACALHGEGLSGEHGLEVAEGTDHYSRVEEGPLSQFLPYGFGAIPGRNHAVFANVSTAECALRCLDEARFRCNSFDFVVGARLCQLSNSFAALVGGIRTDLGTNVMHFERLTSLERSFLGTAGAFLGHGWVRTVRQIGPSRCAMLCLRETAFICRSFDYSLATLECHLSSLMESDVGSLVTNMSQPHQPLRDAADDGLRGQLRRHHGNPGFGSVATQLQRESNLRLQGHRPGGEDGRPQLHSLPAAHARRCRCDVWPWGWGGLGVGAGGGRPGRRRPPPGYVVREPPRREPPHLAVERGGASLRHGRHGQRGRLPSLLLVGLAVQRDAT